MLNRIPAQSGALHRHDHPRSAARERRADASRRAISGRQPLDKADNLGARRRRWFGREAAADEAVRNQGRFA
jgi:hypothetical protein